MSRYRIKQEGSWFYPQTSRLGLFWVGFFEEDVFFPALSKEVAFSRLDEARKFIDNEIEASKPKPPPPVKIHPYP